MSVNTKIQFRRGYSTGYTGDSIANPALPQNDNDPNYTRPTTTPSFRWTDNILLVEGEIGYEIDTGKFKIGRVSGGSLTPWVNLPYAGGSDIGIDIIKDEILYPGSGITLIEDEDNNAYAIYNILKHADDDTNISISNILASGDLYNGVDNVTGNYYKLGLAENISISGAITVSGVNVRNITSDIIVTEAVGGLSKGTVLNSASGITEVLRTILEKVFEPTVGAEPSVSINLSGSVSPAGSSLSFTHNGRYEVGTTGNITISSILNQGFVAGIGLGAEWNSNGNQGERAGTATEFNRSLTGGLSNTAPNTTSNTFNNYTIVLGLNTASATITHNSGITPVNSLGVNSTVLTVLQAGNTVTGSRTFTGVRRLFYNFDTIGLAPTTSADIRSLDSTAGAFDLGKSVFNFGVGTVLRVEAISGTKRVVIAVPAGLYGLGNTITVLDETSLNANISSSYNLTQINVSGANDFATLLYNVYTFIPDVPFSTSSVHKITIN